MNNESEKNMVSITYPAPGAFRLELDGRLLIAHSPARPALFLGRGNEDIQM